MNGMGFPTGVLGLFLLVNVGLAQQPKPDWLDAYLADEMGYDANQIKQFKSNVANLTEHQMKSMLRRIKFYRPFRDEVREIRMASTRTNYERMAVARDTAYAYPDQPAHHQPGSEEIRSFYRNPQGQSLFGGYSVQLGFGFAFR